MAEGGVRKVKGSDFLFDIECTECLSHGSRPNKATHVCMECTQFLCQICLIYHYRYKSCHPLVNIELLSKSQLPKAGKPPTLSKCTNHHDRDVEKYCATHRMVYVSLCVEKDHRSCRGVKEIKVASHHSNLSTLQQLVFDLTNVNEQFRDTLLKRTSSVTYLKRMKANLLKEIKALRKRMNDHLGKLEDQLVSELDAEHSVLEDEVNDDVCEATNIITAIEKEKADITGSYDPTQIEKLARIALNDADRFLKKMASPKRQTLVCEHNAALLKAIETATYIGKLIRRDVDSTLTQKSPYFVNPRTYVSSYNVRMNSESDRPLCNITGMCQLIDGTILVIESVYNKLKRLGSHNNVKDGYGFNANPMGICAVSPTKVDVALSNSTVHLIEVGKSLSHKRKLYLNGGEMNGLVLCSNRFWILFDRCIEIYTRSGEFVKNVWIAEGTGKYITMTNDGANVYVKRYDDSFIVFNKNGDIIRDI